MKVFLIILAVIVIAAVGVFLIFAGETTGHRRR
jgi:hypothetical protein